MAWIGSECKGTTGYSLGDEFAAMDLPETCRDRMGCKEERESGVDRRVVEFRIVSSPNAEAR